MTRSRQRKLRRFAAAGRSSSLRRTVPVVPMLLACMQAAYAADPAETATLEEITVTAQKRVENLQDVPISIQALGTAKLEELHVTNFDDYVKYLPSVSFQSAGPGFEHTYIRGVVSGGDG